IQEIQFLYQQSLLHELQLQQISLKSYDEMLVQAIDSKIYRPTLFDFLAHEALDFLETNEGKTASVFRFKLDDDRYWNDFMNLSLQANDSLSSLMQAMKIYRRLLAFHQNDQDPTAYINLELERLRFLYEQGTYTDVSKRYQNALIQFKTHYAHHPSSTLIDFELASLLFKEGGLYKPKSTTEHQYKKKEAWQLCDMAIRNFPQGYGAEKCRLLKENIELRKLQLTAERFIPIRKFSRIQVEYTSIDSLTFSAYRVPTSFAQKFYYLTSDSMKLAALNKLHTEASWKVSLIKSQDYQHHVTEVVVPPLPQGQYLVVAHTINEPSHSTLFGYATIQCTNLAMIESRLDQNQRYQVVDRNSGRPIVGADIHFKSHDTLSSKQRFDEHRTTEKDGFTEIKKKKFFIGDLDATVIYQSDTAHLGEYSFQPIREPEENDNDEFDAKTFLFSDRSIYRPGQTVYFKGILIKIKGKKSTVVAGEYVEVILENTNGEEVEKIRLKTNAYGSFSGEFKLPSTGLTGTYTLYADEDTEEDTRFYDDVMDFDYVNLTISVEEYKRPTFETTFKPTTQTFTLLDTVSVIGSATAYNGSKISGAKVSYRVKRNVRFPRWYYWDNSYSPSDEVEITHGEITTNDEGGFKINFAAIPDEKVSKESRPVFQYEITADVTDVNGETRSATTYVNVGFHSLLITLQGARTIDKRNQYYPIQLSVENLNGQPAHAKGIIRLYKLKYPIAPVRNRPWSEPDLPLLTEREFISLFPNDSYGDGNPLSEHGAKVSELPFNTEVTKNITVAIDPSWPIGSYEMELIAKDNAGNDILEKHRFEVSDSRSKAIADNALLLFETDQSSYRIGDVAKVKVGSASTDITLTLEVEHNDQIIRTYVEHFSGNYKEFTIPITESMGEGFRVICSGVNYNSFIKQAKNISIIRDKDKMDIETITFKDKLQPGSKEMWSFEIKGNDAPLKEAEVLASMYDASLDQFKDHKWYFEPQRSQPYYSYYAPTAHQSFGDKNFVIRNQRYGFTSIPDIYYDAFDWFGFTITKNSYVHRKYLERFYSDGVHTGKPSKVSLGHNKTIRKGYIEGTIRAGDGSLMAGVNVVIKGTTIGTMTDEKGNYSMKAGKGDIIVYSFIGYSTAEFTVKAKNVMDVTMEEDITQLSEVVVVGYGVVTQKSLTGSITYISGSSDQGDYTLEQLLQGRVAGVQITNASGGNARLVIRGNNSLQGNNEPLYIVDGIFVKTSKIDQSDLASIQVLKGSAAVSLYGSRAVNGVFIISTKSGQKKLDEELAKVSVRKELKETAFFFPHLKTNEEGRIQFSFTAPEALTRWKLQLLAHTKDLLTATKTLQTVTQKELMVTPNPPRFLRVGDEIVFATKISNLAGESKSGIASLQLTNALTGAPIDQLVGNNQRNQSFTLTSKGNTQVSWRLKIPQEVDAIQYKVIAKVGNFSDGEQNVLPVLSNRILVTETLPMQIRAGQTKTFRLDKLKEAASPTLQPHQLTLEVTSNPAWYALQALPYLMEYPHECAEQTFARYYANLLGSQIANSHPKIKHVFDQWTSSDALISNLEKNPELKSILIQETPWILDAQNESDTKKSIGLIF
ncbi:MAG: MG2 domain-containing protein, partial [Cyclobacteriaceae bacterium]